MRSAAKTASVPSWLSIDMAAATSAVSSSTDRSWSAISSIPSIPSVPLMRASPSFSRSTSGSMPASARASAAGTTAPAAVRTSDSPIAASATCDSGARSPEQPSDPYSRTIGVIPAFEHGRVGLHDDRAHSGVTGREGLQTEQLQRPHDLALHLRRRCPPHASG